MKQSIVIELAGHFVGVAIDDAGPGFRFVVVDDRLHDLAGCRWPNLASLRFAARRALRCRSGQGPARRDATVACGPDEERQPSSDGSA